MIFAPYNLDFMVRCEWRKQKMEKPTYLNKLPILIMMVCGKILGSDIGDFSPISVGDTWIYSNKYSTHWCCGPGDLNSEAGQTNTTIQIKSKSKIGDTLKYQGLTKDSLFLRRSTLSIALSDTVKEYAFEVVEIDGKFILSSYPYGLINAMFAKHTYPESLVTNNSVSGGFSPLGASVRTYLKDVGLIRYQDIENHFNYELKEFNGKQHLLSINIGIGAGKSVRRGIASTVYLSRGKMWRINGVRDTKHSKTN